MFARPFRRLSTKRLSFRAFNTNSKPLSTSRAGLGAAAAAVAGSTLLYLRPSVIENDGPSVQLSQPELAQKLQSVPDDSTHLRALVWGSNQDHVLSPQEEPDSIRTPAIVQWLDDVALRDAALHKTHAACVDARGDVYQWGDGFFGEDKRDTPKLTLRGKNIKMLKATEHRIFALSASGRVYVLSAHQTEQKLPPGKPTPASDSWWGTGWLWGEEQTIDFAEVTPNVSLSRGERFVSISAGHDHLLGLTSKGRTFVHAFNDRSNEYGQLGLRKFDIPSGSSERTSIELVPKFTSDPFARASRYSRPTQSVPTAFFNERDIHGSDRFFELSSLKGIEVAQIATGGRTSFVRTKTGQVLGWGANEFGQVGLGSNVTLDAITVPTEVILWKNVPGRSSTRCVDIVAGGDLTCFVVERSNLKENVPTYDLLMCGNGQWGGLGNNIFTNVQGEPVKSRNVSGLLEYSEKKQKLEPIVPYAVSVSPTGHILLTLDTLSQATPNTEGAGRDLYVWGANHESELGNNKRSSLPVPTALETNDRRFMLGKKEKVQVIKDLKGKVWKKNANVVVEQCAVTGWKTSLVYWKIVA